MKLEISEQQAKNLAMFLSRVQLAGHEAEVFVDLLAALRKPIEGYAEESTQ